MSTLARRRWRGGPRFVARVEELRQALYEAVTADDFLRVTRAVVDRAAGGDIQAAKLLLYYLIGRPLPGRTALGMDNHTEEVEVGPLQAQVAAWLAGLRDGGCMAEDAPVLGMGMVDDAALEAALEDGDKAQGGLG